MYPWPVCACPLTGALPEIGVPKLENITVPVSGLFDAIVAVIRNGAPAATLAFEVVNVMEVGPGGACVPPPPGGADVPPPPQPKRKVTRQNAPRAYARRNRFILRDVLNMPNAHRPIAKLSHQLERENGKAVLRCSWLLIAAAGIVTDGVSVRFAVAAAPFRLTCCGLNVIV